MKKMAYLMILLMLMTNVGSIRSSTKKYTFLISAIGALSENNIRIYYSKSLKLIEFNGSKMLFYDIEKKSKNNNIYYEPKIINGAQVVLNETDTEYNTRINLIFSKKIICKLESKCSSQVRIGVSNSSNNLEYTFAYRDYSKNIDTNLDRINLSYESYDCPDVKKLSSCYFRDDQFQYGIFYFSGGKLLQEKTGSGNPDTLTQCSIGFFDYIEKESCALGGYINTQIDAPFATVCGVIVNLPAVFQISHGTTFAPVAWLFENMRYKSKIEYDSSSKICKLTYFHNNYSRTLEFKVGEKKVTFNNNNYVLQATSYLTKDGVIMFPLRSFCAIIDLSLRWRVIDNSVLISRTTR